MTSPSPAELALQELGITEPQEIEIEAIAWHLGATVRFRPLDGCEARIIGVSDRAIITVNNRSSWRRQRFSAAHELGHWRHHRRRLLVCRSDEIGARRDDAAHMERTADNYAADLLLPRYIFDPVARAHPKLTMQTVRTLSNVFESSRTSTAIRLVESKHTPAILVCHDPRGRKWFTRSPEVPARWFPQDQLDSESLAMEVLFGKREEDAFPRRIGADAWFDRTEATNYEIREQSMRVGPDEILTILLIEDDKMLEEWGTGGSRR